MLGATWNVHLRVPPGRDDEQLATALARKAGQLLDDTPLAVGPGALQALE